MRYLLNFAILLCLGLTAIAQGPLITEIGYDNNYDQEDPFGIDSIEYVEIYLPDPQPTDLTSFQIITYDEVDPNASTPTLQAEKAFTRDLTDAIRTWDTPNGQYYVIEFVDSTFFTFPIGGIRDGEDGIALVEIGTPNIVHQFWRYETCEDFVAIDGSAAGATSDPITTDFSRSCGSAGVSLVQMNSALNTNRSIQQNGFGDWYLGLNTSRQPPLENDQNVPVNLMFFDVVGQGDKAKISWATAQELNNSHFEIQYAKDGRTFNKFRTVGGKGTVSSISEYEIIIENLRSGMHYFRLRQVDFNGNYKDYDIKSLSVEADDDFIIYPTQVQQQLFVENIEAKAEYVIFSLDGKIVKQGKIETNSIDTESIETGSYYISINGKIKKFLKL